MRPFATTGPLRSRALSPRCALDVTSSFLMLPVLNACSAGLVPVCCASWLYCGQELTVAASAAGAPAPATALRIPARAAADLRIFMGSPPRASLTDVIVRSAADAALKLRVNDKVSGLCRRSDRV